MEKMNKISLPLNISKINEDKNDEDKNEIKKITRKITITPQLTPREDSELKRTPRGSLYTRDIKILTDNISSKIEQKKKLVDELYLND